MDLLLFIVVSIVAALLFDLVMRLLFRGKETPSYKVVSKKNSSLMRLVARLLFFNKTFMTDYVTTIGYTIYTPDGTISDVMLAHERQHVSDYHRFGLFFMISYLFLLPTVLTMRSFWEKRAYAVTIAETKKYNPDFSRDPEFKESIVRQFVGANYLFMNPFRNSVGKWFDQELRK